MLDLVYDTINFVMYNCFCNTLTRNRKRIKFKNVLINFLFSSILLSYVGKPLYYANNFNDDLILYAIDKVDKHKNSNFIQNYVILNVVSSVDIVTWIFVSPPIFTTNYRRLVNFLSVIFCSHLLLLQNPNCGQNFCSFFTSILRYIISVWWRNFVITPQMLRTPCLVIRCWMSPTWSSVQPFLVTNNRKFARLVYTWKRGNYRKLCL